MFRARLNPDYPISVCPSAPHRAVLGLLPIALGYTRSRAFMGFLENDLKASKPEDIVRISTYHYVHTVLASAFDNAPELRASIPRDLEIYFAEMQIANLRRNEKFLQQLKEIGEKFADRGIEGIVLKGGAELVAPAHKNPGIRFLSDLDILVSNEDIDAASYALQELGGIKKQDGPDQSARHHLPQIFSPDWAGPVELHKRLGGETKDEPLPARVVIENSRASHLRGILVPTNEHRFIHMILHAKADGDSIKDRSISPRDCLDFELMSAAFSKDVKMNTSALFQKYNRGNSFSTLQLNTELLFGEKSSASFERDAKTILLALNLFGRPKYRQLLCGLKMTRFRLWQFLSNPRRRKHYLERFQDSEIRRKFLSIHSNTSRKLQ